MTPSLSEASASFAGLGLDPGVQPLVLFPEAQFDATENRRSGSAFPEGWMDVWERRGYPNTQLLWDQAVTLLDDCRMWLSPALQALDRLSKLPEDWDGYGSPGVAPAEVGRLVRVILCFMDVNAPVPRIVPVSGGGLQVEWEYHGRSLEMEFEPGRNDLLYLKVHENGVMEEGSVSLHDVGFCRDLVFWLLRG